MIFEKNNLLSLGFDYLYELPKTFLIVTKFQTDIIINVHRSSRLLPVILVRF